MSTGTAMSDGRPTSVSNFTSDFSILEWLGNDRIASSLFDVGEFYRFLNMRYSIFSLYGKDGEDRTGDLTVHNLTSCRRRHCEGVYGLKMLRNKCYSSFCLLNSIFHHACSSIITSASTNSRTAAVSPYCAAAVWVHRGSLDGWVSESADV